MNLNLIKTNLHSYLPYPARNRASRFPLVWMVALILALFLLTLSPPPTVSAAPADDFVITVRTDNPGSSTNLQFTIPTFGGGYNYNVDCDNNGTDEATDQLGSYTCNYGVAGTYTIRIKDNSGFGTGFPRIYFNNGGDRQKLLTVAQWGTGQWDSMVRAFAGCNNLTITASDAPNLSAVTDMTSMFQGATTLNQSLNSWDTSSVTNMGGVFNGAISFNQPLNNWNTSNVTNMFQMFRNASAFNVDITGWNTSNVTTMGQMFFGATSFDQPIGSWTTSSVVNMSGMFNGATSFNQSLNAPSWDTSNVTNMAGMFNDATDFNGAIGNWTTGSVLNMFAMFSGATNFNQNLNSWDTSSVTDMREMFDGATAFNQPVGNWNTSSVTNMYRMFQYATNFNQPLNSWDVSNVTEMAQMLRFNGFNQPLDNWNTGNVTSMSNMFAGSSFNQDIGGWDVTALTTAAGMFTLNSALSTANYDALLIGWEAQLLNNNVFLNGGNSYCLGETARANMINDHSWTITDGGRDCGTVWDGGGVDNNWSTPENWSDDAVPLATDNVVFDNTSSKDAVIDVTFGSAVGGVIITDGYNGRISFASPLAVDGYYNQDGGTVVVNPAHAFTVDGAFNHTGGTLEEARTVNNATVPFLEISNSGNDTVKYRGVDVVTTANLDNTTVTVRAVDSGAGEYCTDTGAASPAYAERCYTITPTTNGAAKVRLWALTSELNGILETDLSVYRDTGPSTWGELTINRLFGNDLGSYSYAEGDTAGFSAFLLGQTGNNPTAVTLSNIATQSTGGVNWAVGLTLVLLLVVSGWYLTRRRHISG